MIVRTGQYYSVARTKEAYSDGSALVERFNTKADGTGNASQKYLKAYADSKAEAGEVYQMKGDPTKRLWALVPQERHGVHVLLEDHGERATSSHAPSICQNIVCGRHRRQERSYQQEWQQEVAEVQSTRRRQHWGNCSRHATSMC
jgi:hypothetical protein